MSNEYIGRMISNPPRRTKQLIIDKSIFDLDNRKKKR